MKAPNIENLDLSCAKVGKEIAEKPAKELEKLITDAIGVLEEQGVYALFLFLKARGGTGAENVSRQLSDLLGLSPRLFSSLQELSEDLDNLLLSRDLLRQTLVYARYHARIQEEKVQP